MTENEKKNRPQDDPATSSNSNEMNNDIISPKNENVNSDMLEAAGITKPGQEA